MKTFKKFIKGRSAEDEKDIERNTAMKISVFTETNKQVYAAHSDFGSKKKMVLKRKSPSSSGGNGGNGNGGE